VKLHNENNDVVRSSQFEQSDFTIESSAKAFQILSSGLYSDKILAVIRELSTNAYDSHVDTGNQDKPFEVHMPTKLDTKFSIRDFGTGLSHDDCMNLYTTYFGSTKTDSNDVVGCLGLGSKSPFAYTDAFNVSSFHNGKLRVYTAYKNEDNTPAFALISESDTDEPNGMLITLNVESQDVGEFKEKAEKVYKYFKVRPTFNIDMDVQEDSYAVVGSSWGVPTISRTGVSRRREPVAVMGQLYYPIDSEHFDGKYEDMLSSDIVMHFDIGELAMDASREKLEYTKQTKQAIQQSLDFVKEELHEQLDIMFDHCESLYEARAKYHRMKGGSNFYNNFDIQDVTPKWRGQDLFEDGWQSLEVVQGSMLVDLFRKDRWARGISRTGASRINFDPHRDTQIVYDDLKRGGVGRTKNFFASSVPDNRYEDSRFATYLFRSCDLQDVIDFLGCNAEDIILTSSLPKAASASGGSVSGSARTNTCYWEDGDWIDNTVDMSQGGYYVEINRYEVVNDRGSQMGTWNNVDKLLNALKEVGFELAEGEKVYGFKSSKVKQKRFNKDGNWINLVHIIKDVVESCEWYQESYAFSKAVSNMGGYANVSEFANMIRLAQKSDVPEDYQKFADEILTAQPESRIQAVRVLQGFSKEWARSLDNDDDIEFYFEWIKGQRDSLIEKYPLLDCVTFPKAYWEEEEIQARHNAIAEYLRLLDSDK
jgi:hypothetical protein